MSASSESYKCERCGSTYRDDPGPTQCPSCGHLYVVWLTHEKNFGSGRRGGASN